MPERAQTFDEIWSKWVVPLAGREIEGLNGLKNEIVAVDSLGVVRISRNKLRSQIPIEPFRWAVARIYDRGWVLRKEIHDQFPHRYSSGVQLVLEQVPLFVVSGRPARIALRSWSERGRRFVDGPGDVRITAPADKPQVSRG